MAVVGAPEPEVAPGLGPSPKRGLGAPLPAAGEEVSVRPRGSAAPLGVGRAGVERKEKVELILEQMRLCLATKDYIRAQIISKKISIRFFEKSEHQDLKLKFYRYMIEMDEHDGNYLNICRYIFCLFHSSFFFRLIH